ARDFETLHRAVIAAGKAGDSRALPALERLETDAFDGRLRRRAFESARTIRERGGERAELNALRAELEALRSDHRRLEERLGARGPA
ncbi:MAG: hypothetical protein ABI346_06115, partial [Candidatus Baltobacteraceae bacterium]